MQSQRWQPTRVLQARTLECHFLLQCMKVKKESEVAQSCPTLSDPMDCSLPGSSVHGIFQARVLEWSAIAFSGKYMLQPDKSWKHAKWKKAVSKNDSIWYHLDEMSRRAKSRKESTLELEKWEGGSDTRGGESYRVQGFGVLLLRGWKSSKTDSMVVFIYEYTKNHWIIHFKWMNSMVCELYFNKGVIYRR